MKFARLFLLLSFCMSIYATKRSLSDVKNTQDSSSSNEDSTPPWEKRDGDNKESAQESSSEKSENKNSSVESDSKPVVSNQENSKEEKNSDNKNDHENKSSDTHHKSESAKTSKVNLVSDTSVEKDTSYKEEQAIISQELEDLDSEDEGNWLLKRVWWEQGQDLFEKIMVINNQITKNQVSIMNLREKELKQVDELFRSLGLEQDKLKSQIEYVFNLIDNAKNEDLVDEFSALEQELYEKVEKYEEDYKSLKQSLDDLADNDDLLVKSINQINKLVEECRNYEKQSWQNLKEIGQILNDEKAKDLFYKIQSNYENVEALLNYINTELEPFIKNSISTIKNNSQSISDMLNDLESKEASLDQVIQEHKEAWEAKEKAKQLQEKKKKEMLAKKKRLANRTWYQKVWDWIKSWF